FAPGPPGAADRTARMARPNPRLSRQARHRPGLSPRRGANPGDVPDGPGRLGLRLVVQERTWPLPAPIPSMARAHPRISVSCLSSLFQSFDADLAMWKELDVDHVALISPKIERVGWETAPALVDGLQVSNIAAEMHVLHESIDLAAAVGAEVVYIL